MVTVLWVRAEVWLALRGSKWSDPLWHRFMERGTRRRKATSIVTERCYCCRPQVTSAASSGHQLWSEKINIQQKVWTVAFVQYVWSERCSSLQPTDLQSISAFLLAHCFGSTAANFTFCKWCNIWLDWHVNCFSLENWLKEYLDLVLIKQAATTLQKLDRGLISVGAFSVVFFF